MYSTRRSAVKPRRKGGSGATWHAKRDKDLRQATLRITVLEETRPGDLALAREALVRRGPSWEAALGRGLDLVERQSPGLSGRLRRR